MRTTRRPISDPKIYENYYLHQVGQGMPAFEGPNLQRGYGLGGILGGLFRSAMPLLRRGVRALGKQALKTGVNIAQDALSGQNLRTAAKRRLKESGRNLGRQAVKHISGAGRGRPRKKSIKHRSTDRHPVISRKRTRRTRSPDIFG